MFVQGTYPNEEVKAMRPASSERPPGPPPRTAAVSAVDPKRPSSAVHYGAEGAPLRKTVVIPEKPHIPTVTELAGRAASLKRTKNWKRKTKRRDREMVSEREGQPKHQGGAHFVQGGLPELGRR